MSETKSIRINSDLWGRLEKAVAGYDFTVKDLVELILSDLDLDKYAKKFARKLEAEEKADEEDEREDERRAEDEETSTDEELAESADDEAENFGKY